MTAEPEDTGVVVAAGPLATATASGVRLDALRTLRDRLAGDIDVCRSARDVAALSQRLLDVLAQIDTLGGSVSAEPGKKGTPLDELAKRRADAGAVPAAKPRSARQA